jgi:Na+/H+ antiporter NhaD/arsenite permease-like protein
VQPEQVVAAVVFAATFLLLAVGQVGRRKLPRGFIALGGGLATWVALRLSWAVIDFDILLLLAALMVLAGLAEAAGLFAGLRRLLLKLHPGLALWVSLVLMAVVSAILLNDAAVLVLVPFLLPMTLRLGLKPVPVVALLAVAANLGGLLTPFGNPQNVVLAGAGHLDTLAFLRVQGPLVLLGLAVLALPCWWLGRHLQPIVEEEIAPATPRGPRGFWPASSCSLSSPSRRPSCRGASA